MVSFAGIGSWRFGNKYDEFGSFERSMQVPAAPFRWSALLWRVLLCFHALCSTSTRAAAANAAAGQTEFELMFGEFLPFWGESREMQAFVVLYYMVMFMLILNFLLGAPLPCLV
eukprot:2425236-Rhodomonas_salina.4